MTEYLANLMLLFNDYLDRLESTSHEAQACASTAGTLRGRCAHRHSPLSRYFRCSRSSRFARALHLSLSLTTPSSTVRKYNNNKIGRHGQEALGAE